MMTFYEWFNDPDNSVFGESPKEYVEFCALEGSLTLKTVEELMADAWNARYETLTTQDI